MALMEKAPSVPTTDTAGHVKGYGTLGGPAGGTFRGIQNGVPYGDQLEIERADIARRYRFQPRVASRLRAATRKALRRG